jgi:antirestriction protein ArdC
MTIDIAQIITDRIISELEKGSHAMGKAMEALKINPGRMVCPITRFLARIYSGMNHIWLSMVQGAYPSPYWLTLKAC